jgi:hypothetical protein
VSLSELDSHGYELWIRDGSMEVHHGDTWLSFEVLGMMISMR